MRPDIYQLSLVYNISHECARFVSMAIHTHKLPGELKKKQSEIPNKKKTSFRVCAHETGRAGEN